MLCASCKSSLLCAEDKSCSCARCKLRRRPAGNLCCVYTCAETLLIHFDACKAVACIESCGCRGLVEYAAPLCYLFADQASCAALFCSMYARFWCRLHTIDDTAGKHATLVSLCVLFLHLLEVHPSCHQFAAQVPCMRGMHVPSTVHCTSRPLCFCMPLPLNVADHPHQCT